MGRWGRRLRLASLVVGVAQAEELLVPRARISLFLPEAAAAAAAMPGRVEGGGSGFLTADDKEAGLRELGASGGSGAGGHGDGAGLAQHPVTKGGGGAPAAEVRAKKHREARVRKAVARAKASAPLVYDDAARLAAVRRYLSAVYPLAASTIADGSRAVEVRAFYESLDYYYDCDAMRLSHFKTHLRLNHNGTLVCGAIAGIGVAPPLPYVAPGAYYSAYDATGFVPDPVDLTLEASFTRWQVMGRVVDAPVDDVHALFASFAARLGPAPSWTSPVAVAKYVHYPRGLAGEASTTNDNKKKQTANDNKAARGPPRGTFFRKPADPSQGLWPPFDDDDNDDDDDDDEGFRGGAPRRRRRRLRALRDGDFVEVEQYGGADWVTTGLPMGTDLIFGLFANVWRGTGVFLRVRAPFVSRSKGAAIAEMLEELQRRDATVAMVYFRACLWRAGLLPVFLGALKRHPGENPAHVACVVLLTAEPPCAVVASWNATIEPLWTRWRERSLGAATGFPTGRPWPRKPRDIFADLALRGPPTNESAALAWINGICGIGPFGGRGPSRSMSVHMACRQVARARKRGEGPVLARHFAACVRRWVRWDALMMVLACALGVHTLILDTSPNDNGLFHQELVDYDVPGAWPPFPDGDRRNELHAPNICLKPFNDGLAVPTVATVLDSWTRSGKFSLVDPFQPNASRPCALTGAFADPARVNSTMRGTDGWCANGCFLACNGTMSQAHAPVGLATRLRLYPAASLKSLWGPLPRITPRQRTNAPPKNQAFFLGATM